MNKNNKGFSVVEVLIVIVILGLVGTVGWFVWDKQNNPNLVNMASPTKSVDTPKGDITYSVMDAINTIEAELSKENKLNLTSEDIRVILNTEFEWQDKYSGDTSDKEQFIKTYPFPIDYMKAKLTDTASTPSNQRTFTEDEILAVYNAEEVYLIKIGAIDPTISDQKVKDYNRIN